MKQSGAGREVPVIRRRTRSSGARGRPWAALLLSLMAGMMLSACYTFGGGGGFPPKLKTVAIIPFDNLTDTPEIQRELIDALRKAFHDKLDLRDAPEDKADVLVTGVIGKYEPGLPAGVSADVRQANVSRRNLQLVIDIEVTNQQTGKALLSSKGLQSEGQYAEGQEAAGRKLAIDTMLDMIIQKSQSQW